MQMSPMSGGAGEDFVQPFDVRRRIIFQAMAAASHEKDDVAALQAHGPVGAVDLQPASAVHDQVERAHVFGLDGEAPRRPHVRVAIHRATDPQRRQQLVDGVLIEFRRGMQPVH